MADFDDSWDDESGWDEAEENTRVDAHPGKEASGPVINNDDASSLFSTQSVDVSGLSPVLAQPQMPQASLSTVVDDDENAPTGVKQPSGSQLPWGKRRISEPIAQPDHWEQFDEKSGWKGTTGKQNAVSPQKPKNYVRRSVGMNDAGRRQPIQAEARLVCIKGADMGRESAVARRQSTSIGRAPDNDIVLQEVSVSRQHAEIICDTNKYLLVDKQSGNGTFVNGQRVKRTKIRSGDEIGFGNGIFRFLETGAVFQPVDARGAPVLPGARRGLFSGLRGWYVGGGIVALTTTLVLAVLTVTVARRSQSQSDTSMLFRYYMQGIDAFRRHDWAEANNQFTVLLGYDPTHPRGRRYLQAVASEQVVERTLLAAKEARTNGQLARAYGLLTGIRTTAFVRESQALLRAIEAELDARVGLARTLLLSNKPKEALHELNIVESIRPGRPDVMKLMERVRRRGP